MSCIGFINLYRGCLKKQMTPKLNRLSSKVARKSCQTYLKLDSRKLMSNSTNQKKKIHWISCLSSRAPLQLILNSKPSDKVISFSVIQSHILLQKYYFIFFNLRYLPRFRLFAEHILLEKRRRNLKPFFCYSPLFTLKLLTYALSLAREKMSIVTHATVQPKKRTQR